MRPYNILFLPISIFFITSCTHPVKEVYVNVVTNNALESSAIKDLGDLKELITPFQNKKDTMIIFHANIIRADIDKSTGIISFESPMNQLNKFMTGKIKDGRKEEKLMNKAIEKNTYPILTIPTNENYLTNIKLIKSTRPSLYILTDTVFKYTINGITDNTFKDPHLLKREIEKNYITKIISDTIYVFYRPFKTAKEFEIIFRELNSMNSISPIIGVSDMTVVSPIPIMTQNAKHQNAKTGRTPKSSSPMKTEELNTNRMIIPPYDVKK